MEENDFINLLMRLKKILREASLLLSFPRDEKKAELDECFNNACQILFANDFHQKSLGRERSSAIGQTFPIQAAIRESIWPATEGNCRTYHDR